MYSCDKCGSCCRSLHLNSLYSDLDRGDGICKYLDVVSNLCTVYTDRPDLCNIEKMYKSVFYEYYSEKDYIEINKKYCRKLRGM